MLEAGLVSLIKADAGLAALIGPRIYATVTPPDNPNIYPCLVFQGVTSSSEFAVDGKTKTRVKLIQFSAIGTYSECKKVLTALEVALDGYVGMLSDGTRVLIAYLEDDRDGFGNDSLTYHSSADYTIEYSQP